jgi:hypothetical protein
MAFELTGNMVGDILALYGSSFFLIPLIAQSNVENKPPQTPKFPPSTGARAFIAVRAPILRSPYGELRKPFTPCQTAPPIAYSTGHASVCVICGGEDGADADVMWLLPAGLLAGLLATSAGLRIWMEEYIHPYKTLLRNHSAPPRGRGLVCDPSSMISG